MLIVMLLRGGKQSGLDYGMVIGEIAPALEMTNGGEVIEFLHWVMLMPPAIVPSPCLPATPLLQDTPVY